MFNVQRMINRGSRITEDEFYTGSGIRNPESDVRRRKSAVVGLLSFFISGLGHVYIGEARRGIFLFLGETLLTVIFLTSNLAFSVAGLLSFLTVFILYRVFVIADSILLNRQRGPFELKSYNRFIAYAGYVLVATVVSTTIQFNTARIEAFKIPSPSMVPTVIPGDQIMVDRWAYRSAAPARGDLIVFKHPTDPGIDFIKRCVAVGGDTIEIRDKVLFLNRGRLDEPYAVFHGQGLFFPGRDNFGPYTVPKGKVFVLGDNRDESRDSRYFGAVDLDDVQGKVRVIYWSRDTRGERIRWERIGSKF